MKLLLVHNYYQQPGGEDQVFADEFQLLKDQGHAVEQYQVHNDAIGRQGSLRTALNTVWNTHSAREIARLVKERQVGLVHFHNTFPLLSPSVYRAARQAGAAVVQTLHNFRLTCAAATLLRQGKVCESCVGSWLPWAGVAHRCYRGSLGASAALTAMLMANRWWGTYRHQVDAYIALTPFAKAKFQQAGLPAGKLYVKPNFIARPPSETPQSQLREARPTVLFVGRLSPEKGIGKLLDAWKHVQANATLRIVGDGPDLAKAQEAAKVDPRIVCEGWQPKDRVAEAMQMASLLVMPSLWYEGFPKTLIEAMIQGTPVLVSNLGSLADIVTNQVNGWTVNPEDKLTLATAINTALAQPDQLREIGLAGRKTCLERYTAATNYGQLLQIYQHAWQQRWGDKEIPPWLEPMNTSGDVARRLSAAERELTVPNHPTVAASAATEHTLQTAI